MNYILLFHCCETACGTGDNLLERGTEMDKNRCAVVMTTLLTLIAVTPAHGEDRSIAFGDIEVRLGMTKSEVIKRLEDRYKMRYQDTDSWLVMSKHDSPHEVIGNMGFRNDRLISIVKNWGSTQDDSSYKLAGKLFSVLSALNQEGNTIAKVKTHTQKEPNLAIYSVVMYFANREVNIVVRSGRAGEKRVSINESITE